MKLFIIRLCNLGSCDLHLNQFEKMFHEKRIPKLCTITNKDGEKILKTLYRVWGTRKFNHKEASKMGIQQTRQL